jgi:hypothetical protein
MFSESFLENVKVKDLTFTPNYGKILAESRGVEPHTFYRTSRLAGGPYHRLGLLSFF